MTINDLLDLTKRDFVYAIFPSPIPSQRFEFLDIDTSRLEEIQKIFNKDSVVFIKITN